MSESSLYPLLDSAELERRAREKKNVWIEGTSIAAVDVAMLAVTANAWPWPVVVAAVAATSGLGYMAVRRLELWWARKHSVPLEMYREQLARYRRTRAKAYTALCHAADLAGELEGNAGDVMSAISNDRQWLQEVDEFFEHLRKEVLPHLEPHEQHELRYIDVDTTRMLTEARKRLAQLRATVHVLRSLMEKYA